MSQPREASGGAASTAAVTGYLPISGALTLLALAYASFARGAYYRSPQLVVGVVTAVALGAALFRRRPVPEDLRVAPVAAAVALAVSATVSAVLAGHPAGAGGTVALTVGMAAIVLAVRRLDDTARDRLTEGLVGLGAVVAFTGLVAVAHRIEPYALESERLWRAATTITYANAAAGMLVPILLVAVARHVGRPGSRPSSVAVFALAAGVGATLSRGGLLALALGGAVLVALVGVRRVATAVWAPAAGAAVALAGLVPSLPADAPHRPLLAWTALAVGAGVAVRAGAPGPTPLVGGLLAGLAALGTVAVAAGSPEAFSAVVESRATLVSDDRRDATAATWRLARSRPLFGVGPGQFVLRYDAGDGRGPLVARYAHNEYLQLLAVQGVVGVGVLVAGVAATAVAVARSRRATDRLHWAGVAAALVAFASHSATDFLWHIPALPLVATALVATVVPPPAGDL